jgi:hypothetical protein
MPQADSPSEPWHALALAGRLAEAVELLRGQVHGGGGMGFYASEGYMLEAAGDALVASDPAGARVQYEAALKSYLCYVLMPARGDSEEDGYGFADAVLAKIKALPVP